MQRIIEERMDNGLRDHLSRISTEVADPADRFIQSFKLTRDLFISDSIGPHPDHEEFEPFDTQAHHETWDDMVKLQDAGTYPGAFAAIESPVLMLHGEYDHHPGEMIRDSLVPHLRNLEYHQWERCGHRPWIEKFVREEFFSVMSEWLTRQTS